MTCAACEFRRLTQEASGYVHVVTHGLPSLALYLLSHFDGAPIIGLASMYEIDASRLRSGIPAAINEPKGFSNEHG